MMRNTVWMVLLVIIGVGVGSGVGAGPLSGQSGELSEVRVAMEEARYSEARSLIETWWEDRARSADRRTQQEALWLRARLTPDPAMAEMDYRRLVVEFPGGAYSDGALLRLAQGAEARGEPTTARRYLEILVRDYPTSEHRVEARDRMARLPEVAEGEGPRRTPTEAAPADTAVLAPPTVIDEDTPAPVPAPIERDTVASDPVTPVVDPDPIPEEPAADPIPAEPSPDALDPADPGMEDVSQLSGPYTVQLGAFSTMERAWALADRVREAGLSVRVVQVEGSALFRVRKGGFESRAAAEAAAQEPRDRGFEALVSVDRELERTP